MILHGPHHRPNIAKVLEWVFTVAGLILLTSLCLTYGFTGLSSRSDLGVIGGIALILVTLSGWIWLFGYAAYQIEKRLYPPQTEEKK